MTEIPAAPFTLFFSEAYFILYSHSSRVVESQFTGGHSSRVVALVLCANLALRYQYPLETLKTRLGWLPKFRGGKQPFCTERNPNLSGFINRGAFNRGNLVPPRPRLVLV